MEDTREIVWYAEGASAIAAQPLAAGTYYAELATRPGYGHAHQFDWNAALAAVITFQGSLKGTGYVSVDDPRSWSNEAGYGTINILAGAVGSETVQIPDSQVTRTRAKAVVTVQGELTGRTR